MTASDTSGRTVPSGAFLSTDPVSSFWARARLEGLKAAVTEEAPKT